MGKNNFHSRRKKMATNASLMKRGEDANALKILQAAHASVARVLCGDAANNLRLLRAMTDYERGLGVKPTRTREG